MTENAKKSQPVVTRLDENWPATTDQHRELVVAEVSRGISRMAMPRRWSFEELRQKKLIYAGMRKRKVLNVFRQLRTRLLQRVRKGNLSIMLSSAGGGEQSAALNAINLAAAFALDPQRTALFIDCNPYQPTAHKYMLERPKYGVTDYLDQPDLPLEDIIYPTGLDRLRVIPAGHASSTAVEQFHSPRMQTLISELKQRYEDRFIIVNAPSMVNSSEAPVLSQYCDLTVLVAPFGKTDAGDIESAFHAVDKRRLAGMIYSYL